MNGKLVHSNHASLSELAEAILITIKDCDIMIRHFSGLSVKLLALLGRESEEAAFC